MTHASVETLNDLLPKLIDSTLGYDKAQDAVEPGSPLGAALLSRFEQRKAIVDDVKSYVAGHGGEPKADGTTLGAAHRLFVDAAGLIQSDRSAALTAIDDGEQRLQSAAQSALDDDAIDPQARLLLMRIVQDAQKGEKLADHFGS
ncbi:MAG: PA2169 family four-helix-bundle protein [Pseudomonadota bacterium]